MKKICKKCKKVLHVSNFYASKALKDGYENKCKECRQEERKKYLVVCSTCQKEFMTTSKKHKYCSPKCKPQSQKQKVKVNCFVCGEQLERTKSSVERVRHVYCSTECKDIGYGIIYNGENHPRYSQMNSYCIHCGDEIVRNRYELEKYKNHFCSNECKVEEYKIMFSGQNNPNYNPNKSEEDRIINRNIDGYNEWVRKVFNRDNYTCKCCGDNKGGNLNAHHILNYMEHPSLRIDLDNGITFCNICHKKFHDTYGYTNNDDKQMIEFLNKYKTERASLP